MAHRQQWPDDKLACLKRLWGSGASLNEMVHALGSNQANIIAKAKELELGPMPAKRTGRENFSTGSAAGGDIKHRSALGFRNPIRLRPASSLIGPPLRTVDLATRALIDEALAARAA